MNRIEKWEREKGHKLIELKNNKSRCTFKPHTLLFLVTSVVPSNAKLGEFEFIKIDGRQTNSLLIIYFI